MDLRAGPIVFTNTPVSDNGTGFGNVLNVLSLQAQGNNTSEFGAALLNNEFPVGDATNQAQTRTVGELTSAGITSDNFGIVLDLNEAANELSVTLHNFTFRFYTDPSDLGQFFDLTFDSPVPLNLLTLNNGNGQSDWFFTVAFTPAQATAFFSNSANRVGAYIVSGDAITDVSDGADSFSIAAIPEPSTTAAIGLGFLLLVVSRRRRVSRCF